MEPSMTVKQFGSVFCLSLGGWVEDWLAFDPPTFDFPIWIPRCRVFDWQHDEADIPVPDPLPPWELDERRQMDLLLRIPGPVVQR
jgi:hypothetical protein